MLTHLHQTETADSAHTINFTSVTRLFPRVHGPRRKALATPLCQALRRLSKVLYMI